MIAFTHELSLLSPEAFAEQVLVAQAGAVHVVVGENYRFGHAAEGDADTLIALGERLGFGVTVGVARDGRRRARLVLLDPRARAPGRGRCTPRACSAATRGSTAPSCAASRAAARSACRPRTCAGRRAASSRRPASTPASACSAPARSATPAAISVGGNPTFGDVEGTVVEAYLIGFDGDAYDRPMRVEFTRFLRHELRVRDASRSWSSRCGATSRPRAQLAEEPSERAHDRGLTPSVSCSRSDSSRSAR